MGDLLRVKYDNQLSEGLLRVLFMYDLHNLDQMLEDVLAGQEWKGVTQVGRRVGHHCVVWWLVYSGAQPGEGAARCFCRRHLA
jgi:hypothetical protein